jgi:hypothetical protein
LINKQIKFINGLFIFFEINKYFFFLSYEQVQLALKKVLSAAILSNEDFSSETFSILGFKLISIDEEKRLTNDIGTNYDPPSLSSKRKLTLNEFNQKHHKNNSSSQRSSK